MNSKPWSYTERGCLAEQKLNKKMGHLWAWTQGIDSLHAVALLIHAVNPSTVCVCVCVIYTYVCPFCFYDLISLGI